MKSDKVKLIISIILPALVITIIVFFITNIYKSNVNKVIEEERKTITEIGSKYETFDNESTGVVKYEEEYTAYINNYIGTYESIVKDYDTAKSKSKSLEAQINDLDKNSEYLKSNCANLYSNKKANEKCNNYSITLEKVINVYVSQLSVINGKIDEYNKAENISKETNLEKLSSDFYNDYVDLNKDGIYLGGKK